MPKLTELQELDAAIRLAASDAEASVPSHQVAQTFYVEHRELVAAVADQWIVEKLTAIISKQRAALRRVADSQFVMEFAIGLTSLPKKVRLRSGKLIERSDMTLTQVRAWIVDLRKKHKTHKGKTLMQAELMAEIMEKHTRRGAGGVRLKWADVREIEVQAVGKKTAKKGAK